MKYFVFQTTIDTLFKVKLVFSKNCLPLKRGCVEAFHLQKSFLEVYILHI